MMNSFLRASLIVLTISGLLFSNVYFGTVQASTDVTGIIASDTTWTKANSPYSLTGNVLVYNGVTLTIEDGVTVNLDGYYIMVNGTLRARGSGTNKIHFNSGEITFTQYSSDWNEQTDSGCIIENANLYSTYVGINFASPKINSNFILRIHVDGSAVISNNTINDGITVSSPSPIISYNIISGGVRISSDSTISHNTISGGVRVSSGSAVISHNTISGGVDASGGSPVISNNVISGGVSVYSKGLPIISHNTIMGGISVKEGSLIISNNTINGGAIGIDLSPAGPIGSINASILNNTITGGEIGINIAPSLTVSLYGYYTDASISGNIIYGCTTAGIKVGGVSGQAGVTPRYNTATIEENTIINNNYGITGVTEPIRNNIIANNSVGISGGSLIERNTIINNYYGIKGGNEIRNNTIVNNFIGVESGFSTLIYNNIHNNSEYNVRFTSSSNPNATYNWWGTTDIQAINQTIYDFKNDFNLGKVNFVPFLTEPNPEEMSTPISEFPSIIILPLFLIATLAVIIIRKKMLR